MEVALVCTRLAVKLIPGYARNWIVAKFTVKHKLWQKKFMKLSKKRSILLIVLTLACSVPSWTAKAADEGAPNPNAAEITNARR